MYEIEICSLCPGDTFYLDPEADEFLVEDTAVIGYDGTALILYRAGEHGLEARARNHDKVWVLA